MVANKVLFGVALLQVITSLCSIALCTTHYSNLTEMNTTAETAVTFAVRFLSTISLLICGIIGVIISCVVNKTLRTVHTTVTVQTTVGIAVNVWFFVYQYNTSPLVYEQNSALRCVISTTLCLATCLGYLVYLAVELGRSKAAHIEQDLKESDLEANLEGHMNVEVVKVHLPSK